MVAEAQDWRAAPDRANPAGRPALAALAWGLGRGPLILLLLLIFRHPILNAVERTFDIIWITELTIQVMSTPLTRLGFFAAVFVALLLMWIGARRLPPRVAWLAGVFGGAVLILGLVEALGTSAKIALALAIVLAANWLPQTGQFEASFAGRALRRVVVWVPLVSEVLLAPRYFRWLLRSAAVRPFRSDSVWITAAPGAFIVALSLAVLVSATAFAPVERALRSGPDVVLMAKGDFNGIELDKTGHALFATGHGLPHLTRYDVDNGRRSASLETTGGSQDLAYDPASDEVLMFDTERLRVLAFDAQTLALRRALRAPDLSPGDPWILFDRPTDTLLLSSEADRRTGAPLLVLDRATGRVLDRRPEEAGNVLHRPGASLVYLSFFRRSQGLLAYDLASRRYVAAAPTDERMDRMAFDSRRGELLVASPVEGRVLRYDADRLKPKGAVKAIFGVRVMAIDPRRDVMFAGSLTTGKVAAIRLSDHRLLASWYVGPWPRTIVLDPARGRAYVSSNGGLYRLQYAARLDHLRH